MLVFEEKGKPENREINLSEEGRGSATTQSTHDAVFVCVIARYNSFATPASIFTIISIFRWFGLVHPDIALKEQVNQQLERIYLSMITSSY